MAIEAVRLAVPLHDAGLLLSDGYLANGAEPWLIPEIDDLPKIEVKFATDPANFMPYARDEETLARPWALPGTPGLEHRIGGIEKQDITGNVNYDPENHQLMVQTAAGQGRPRRARHPRRRSLGEPTGKVLVLGWGSTYGSITSAVEKLQRRRASRSRRAHLRYLNPFPTNLGDVLRSFKTCPHPRDEPRPARTMIRAKYLVDAVGLQQGQGQAVPDPRDRQEDGGVSLKARGFREPFERNRT